ncbi:MAG: ABC transporter permease [Acidimicrobiia bacterium]|nr:ABC transporter permease [Acidimicrobiia bacterium]
MSILAAQSELHFTVQLALLGLLAGAAYAIAAVGMVAIYKGSGVLNFAHGAVAMVAAYVYTYQAAGDDGRSVWIALALGLLAAVVLGAGMHFLVMWPLRRASAVTKMMATFGVMLLLTGAAELRWGTQLVKTPTLWARTPVELPGGYTLDRNTLYTVLLALGIGLVYVVVDRFTLVGRATEAAATDERSALRLGYPVQRLALLNWMFGSLSAGLAGIVIAQNTQLTQAAPTVIILQRALTGALIGGFRSIGWAIAGSFLIGSGEAVVSSRTDWFPVGLAEALPFFVIVLVLVVRGHAIPRRESVVRERQPLAPFPRLSPVLLPVCVAAAVVAPIVLADFWRQQIVFAAAYAIVGLSIVLVSGFLGHVSLAHWTIAGVGAFTAASIAADHGIPMLPAMLVGAAAAFPVGVVIGLLSMRVRGINLVIVTLGAALALQGLWFRRSRVWATFGLRPPKPDLFGRDLGLLGRAYLSLVLVGLAFALVYWLRRSRFGQRLVAIRASERAAAAAGIAVPRLKLLAWGISSSIAAVGGALWAFQAGAITAEANFLPMQGITLLSMVFLLGGGLTSAGALAGFAMVLSPVLLKEWFDLQGLSWFQVLGVWPWWST